MKFKCMLSATALALVSSVASAGFVQPAPVMIDFTNRSAQGDMLTARNSDNPFAYIGCGVRYNTLGLVFAFCQAGIGEAPEEQFACITDNAALVEAIHSISAFSFIVFRWDEDGNCTFIGDSTQSFYLPDLKPKAK